ncbi:contact-dependent growth inhibition system immunity protein [Amycolatopsis sp. cg5]|uniref:contact-dependent growth inhibition system immunity protein n=1 Tax=Amycolatopsis sp. cg5 TaxID=3238802 RepID=UPI003523F0A6
MQSADRRRSLEDVEGERWGGPPADATRLIAEVHRLRQVPIAELTVEDLRLLIGQQIGLAVLVPVAIEVLQRDPLAEGDMFEGDLLRAVLRVDGGFWASRRVDQRRGWPVSAADRYQERGHSDTDRAS